MSLQKVCVMYVVLPENYLMIRKVIPYRLDAQEKPGNARVLQPVSMSATGECITDVQTFITRALIWEKNLGQRSNSAKNMPDVKKVGWNKELQQDVVLPSNSKKILKKDIQEK